MDARKAARISEDLRAAVHEMQMQDLRAWRPGIGQAGGWTPKIALEGEAHLQRALAQGKGAVLWVAPFVFNSGPTKIALHQRGYRVSHLSSPKHGYSETKFGVAYLNKVRCIPEDRYIAQRVIFDRYAPATAMRRLMRAVKAGEVVSIVAASTEGSDMIKGPIFGGQSSRRGRRAAPGRPDRGAAAAAVHRARRRRFPRGDRSADRNDRPIFRHGRALRRRGGRVPAPQRSLGAQVSGAMARLEQVARAAIGANS